MARLYGDKEDIEYGKVKNFFSKRFNKGLESDLLMEFMRIKKLRKQEIKSNAI